MTRRLPGRGCAAIPITGGTICSTALATPCLAVCLPASPSGASQVSHPAASAGVSIPFVDPTLIALDAPIHWVADPGTAMLHALARRAPSKELADVGLVERPCIRQVVIGPDHVEDL